MNLLGYTEKQLDELFKQEDKLVKLQYVLRQLTTQNIIRQMYIDFYYAMDSFPGEYTWTNDNRGIVSYFNDSVTLGHHYTDSSKSYDEIADEATGLGYGNTIQKEILIQKVINNITFTISDYYEANIPEDEMLLLESLGKVDVTYIKASKNSSVFCTN